MTIFGQFQGIVGALHESEHKLALLSLARMLDTKTLEECYQEIARERDLGAGEAKPKAVKKRAVKKE